MRPRFRRSRRFFFLLPSAFWQKSGECQVAKSGLALPYRAQTLSALCVRALLLGPHSGSSQARKPCEGGKKPPPPNLRGKSRQPWSPPKDDHYALAIDLLLPHHPGEFCIPARVTTTSATMSSSSQSVQCFGKKKTATAVAHCKVRLTAALCTQSLSPNCWRNGQIGERETC